ncbi:peptidase family M48-domain-containing protein [Abortiporus biennis]|nr:peptidase family M48-domain-containing protein [Abortiporus biennis]
MPKWPASQSISRQLLNRNHVPITLGLNQQHVRSLHSTPIRRARYVKFGGDPKHPLDISRWDTTTKVIAFIGVAGGLYFVAHLERVPETGRWRFMDINPEMETKLAQAAHEEILSEFKGKILPADHLLTKHIRRVVTRLLDSSNLGVLKSSGPPVQSDVWNPDSSFGRTETVAPGLGGREWELIVVNDDKIANAAATYGNLIVFTGILPIAKDEEGLAAILGHEIGHTVARHNSERFSSMKIFLIFASLIELITPLDVFTSRILATFLYSLPNSRKQELEADEIGLKITAKACYDPRAAIEMFDRLGKLEASMGRSKLSFMYTHPTSEQRIQRLERLLPEAYAIQAETPGCAGVEDSLSAFRNSFASSWL